MPLNTGEYAQPLVRVTWVECPLVAGFTTARLQAKLQYGGTTPVLAFPDNQVNALLENVGILAGTVQFQQTTNDTVSGARIPVGSAVVLVPGGRASVQFTQTQQYLEVWCTGGGPTQLRAQLSSMLQWNRLGFDKSDPYYPQYILQPVLTPQWGP